MFFVRRSRVNELPVISRTINNNNNNNNNTEIRANA